MLRKFSQLEESSSTLFLRLAVTILYVPPKNSPSRPPPIALLFSQSGGFFKRAYYVNLLKLYLPTPPPRLGPCFFAGKLNRTIASYKLELPHQTSIFFPSSRNVFVDPDSLFYRSPLSSTLFSSPTFPFFSPFQNPLSALNPPDFPFLTVFSQTKYPTITVSDIPGPEPLPCQCAFLVDPFPRKHLIVDTRRPFFFFLLRGFFFHRCNSIAP